jgi:MoxR-like ATPase
MEERQVTIDGTTYPMQQPFLVVATQNPIEQEGTYRLPEAQLDRFLFKINVDYPTFEEEVQILRQQQHQNSADKLAEIQPVLNTTDIAIYRELVRGIVIEPPLLEFIARVITSTRNNPSLYLGASPRASLAVMKASKALAAIKGRDFVVPEDVISIIPHVLRHRIILTTEKEMEGNTPDEMITRIIEKVDVPR